MPPSPDSPPADGGAGGAPRAAAQSSFERGLRLAAQREWESALREFLQSRRLFPTRSATRNAAIALSQLGRYADALSLYDVLLSEFALPPEQQAAFQSERAALLPRVGRLELESGQPDTNVVIDGEQRGVLPRVSGVWLDPGPHTLRLTKAGFDSWEGQIDVAAGHTRSLSARLRAQVGAGRLAVEESIAEGLDVVLDGAVVGSAPWRGSVSPGLHSVLLRGSRRGTPPTSVEVKPNEPVTISLRPIQLDSEAVIQPSPPGATVFVDGVFAGNGTWSGQLPSGVHRFEVLAPGRLPFRTDIRLAPNTAARVRAVLVPQSLTSRKSDPNPGPLFAEGSVGLLLGRSFSGDADRCDCAARSRPFGELTQARLGFELDPHLAVDLGGGYLSVADSQTRHLSAIGEPGTSPFVSANYQDSTQLSGPFAALGVSARAVGKVLFSARIAGGVAGLKGATSNDGNFNGLSPSSRTAVTGRLSIPELQQRVTSGFLATELSAGHQFGKRVAVNMGVALYLFLPTHAVRANRAGLLNGPPTTVGVFTLPNETVVRSFLLASPQVSLRVAF